MDDDEDDVDFFTRKPSKTRTTSRTKSASISDANAPKADPAAAIALSEASQSKSRSPLTEEQRKRQHASSSDSESDVEIISSSEDEATEPRRGPKKVKKKPVPALPRWSREKRSASINSVEAQDALPPATGVAKKVIPKPDKAGDTGSQRERDVSLTPPPAPSPDKLQAARALVEHVRASHRIDGYSPGTQAPPNGSARSNDILESSFLDWDPEVAKLYRGENAKEVRERAKQEQEIRRKMRQVDKLRSTQKQSASDPSGSATGGISMGTRAAFSRTVSAPNHAPPTPTASSRTVLPTVSHDDSDSDDSIQLVSGASAIKSHRTGDGSNVSAPIALSDSDDDDNEGNANEKTDYHTPPDSSPSADAEAEDQGEIMSLTLSSSLGSLPVSVRPTVQLSKIVAHFVTTFRAESRPVKQRLPDSVDASRIKIRFDGMLFDPNPKPKPGSKSPKGGVLSDLDIEDGDQIEIVW